ncbi:MAG TPA: hypothetical protein PKE32_08765 [Miltoncostaeaceae bacterium]|nr:hypothetical protein [Miltoncostaeaceae bacterium]
MWLIGVLVLLLMGAVGAPARSAPRVTVIGDSVQESFSLVPRARAVLGRGLDLRMEARVCRLLVRPGCFGGSPESALTVAEGLGERVGAVVGVHVGYNDGAPVCNAPALMRAFRRAGVRAVVWTTLHEAERDASGVNAVIRAIARRHARPGANGPFARIADWRTLSAGRGDWFSSDRVHPNGAGAVALAGLQREAVLDAFARLGVSIDGRPVHLPLVATRLRVGAGGIVAGPDAVWLVSAGRLRGRDDRSGAPLGPPVDLADPEVLLGDGNSAWIADRAAGVMRRAVVGRDDRRSPVAVAADRVRRVAAAGDVLWLVSGCEAQDAECLRGRRLVSPADGEGAPRVLRLAPGSVTAIAANRRALWVAAVAPGGRARLERRAARTGRPLRTVGLPDTASSVAASGADAWVLLADGRLMRVGPSGARRVVRAGVSAVAARDGDVWLLERDRRTIVRLAGRTGRSSASGRVPMLLSPRLVLSARHVWALSRSGRALVSVAR